MTKKNRTTKEAQEEQKFQEMIKELFQRDYTPKFPKDQKEKRKKKKK